MDEKKFEVTKFDNYTVISILVEKLDTHIAPAVKSELVLIAGNGEKKHHYRLAKSPLLR